MKPKLIMALTVTVMLAAGQVQAGLVWHTAYDDPVSGPIAQSIAPEMLELEIVQVRYFTVDGRSADLDIAPGLTSLGDVFGQSWIHSGYETDYYKPVSVFTGANTTTLFLTNDDDVAFPVVESERQIDQPATPNGIFSLGYTDGSGFADAGSVEYRYGSTVYRLDVASSVPEPATLALLGLGSLGLLRRHRKGA